MVIIFYIMKTYNNQNWITCIYNINTTWWSLIMVFRKSYYQTNICYNKCLSGFKTMLSVFLSLVSMTSDINWIFPNFSNHFFYYFEKSVWNIWDNILKYLHIAVSNPINPLWNTYHFNVDMTWIFDSLTTPAGTSAMV